ncbi:MAG TPA: SGNH/GDSL hydrolase family protein [Caulobacteraceae bacterium]|nr:SGNH/GDSL hydrolase family protein [Caulobacteraceae bacterium]
MKAARPSAFGSLAAAMALGLALTAPATSSEAAKKPPAAAAASTPTAADTAQWTATWAASPEPQRPPLVPLAGQTVRQIAHVAVGGIWVRARLSNEFGDKPLTIGAGHLALAAGAGSAIQQGTDRVLLFGGRPSITIPPGASAVSDPVSLTVPPFSNVAVSLYFPDSVGAVTEHFFGMQTGYVTPRDMTAAVDLPGAATITKRVVLSGIDVAANAKTKVVVVLGDQLTGGFGSTVDTNRRWPDFLAQRLATRKGGPLSVVNAGIGGNRLLHDFIGPNAMARFDRDVLAQPNVGYLIVLIGINDFGFPGGRNLPQEDVSADDVIAGYKQLIERAHSHGIRVIGCTMPPFGPIPERPGYYSDASASKRIAVNQWVRSSRAFAGVIDFEMALRDPKDGSRLNPAFDSGDHLDPNDAGYQAMANAVDMRLFE